MKHGTFSHRILCLALTLCLLQGAYLPSALAAAELTITVDMPAVLNYGVPVEIPYQITGGVGNIVDVYYYIGTSSGTAGGYSATIPLEPSRSGIIYDFTARGDSVVLFLFATDSAGTQAQYSSGSIQILPSDADILETVQFTDVPAVVTGGVPFSIEYALPTFSHAPLYRWYTKTTLDDGRVLTSAKSALSRNSGTLAIANDWKGCTGSITVIISLDGETEGSCSVVIAAPEETKDPLRITAEMPDSLLDGEAVDIDYVISGDPADVHYFFEYQYAHMVGYSSKKTLPNDKDGTISFTPDGAADSYHLVLHIIATDSAGTETEYISEPVPVSTPVEPEPDVPDLPAPVITAEMPQVLVQGVPFDVDYTITGGTGDIVQLRYFICYHYEHIMEQGNPRDLPAGREGVITQVTPKVSTDAAYSLTLHIIATDSAGTETEYVSEPMPVSTPAEPEPDVPEPDQREATYAPAYDYDYYLAQNPDIAAAFGDNRTAVMDHFIQHGMDEGRISSPAFSWEIYRTNYPDLAAMFGNAPRDYYEHYIVYGKTEGRVADKLLSAETPEQPVEPEQPDATDREAAYAAVYDFGYYTGKYPDIAAAFNGDRAATLDHFINNGMAEGRQGSSSFNVDCYKANYADLAGAFGSDRKAYYTHFISNGKAEGRVADKLLSAETPEQPEQPSIAERESYYAPVYDFDYYTGKYPDIAAAFGGDRAATLDHFVHHGMNEGRQGCAEFNVNVYRANYPDLEGAFGGDLDDYYKHYINYGKAEGRTAR